MDRLRRLQEEKEDEEASQEEMDTRFEKEKTESLLVVTEGTPSLPFFFSIHCIESRFQTAKLNKVESTEGFTH